MEYEERRDDTSGGADSREEAAEAVENAPDRTENELIRGGENGVIAPETGRLLSDNNEFHSASHDRFAGGRPEDAGRGKSGRLLSFLRFFGKTNASSHGAEPADGYPCDFLMREREFGEALENERKRSERTHRPFLLALLDVERIAGAQKLLKEISRNGALRRLSEALHRSTREIDKKGWFRHGDSIGVIFVESGRESLPALDRKLKHIVAHACKDSIGNVVPVTWGIFPRRIDQGVDQGMIGNDVFYPDPAAGRAAGVKRAVKRAIDITGSALGIMLCIPIFFIIAILIKVTSPGPVFFRQERVGETGRRFVFLKFRSMYTGINEAVHREYIEKFIGGSIEPGEDGKSTVYKLTADARITPIGRILRKISFDELPQLLNVLRGEMSLVGPRPAIPYEVELYQLWHKRRMYIKPGITGRWQVKGRSVTTFDGMVRMDIQYHERWSLFADFKLLVMTPATIVTTRGAY